MSSPEPGGDSAAPRRRRGSASRRLGYAIAIVVNAALLYAGNVWPGWWVLPFLTEDTRQVIGIVNFSLIAGMVGNFACLLLDRPWMKALADLATLGIGLLVLAQLWQVFPFDFQGYTLDWALITRVVLVVAMARLGRSASIAQIVALIRRRVLAVHGSPGREHCREMPTRANGRGPQPPTAARADVVGSFHDTQHPDRRRLPEPA